MGAYDDVEALRRFAAVVAHQRQQRRHDDRGAGARLPQQGERDISHRVVRVVDDFVDAGVDDCAFRTNVNT